MLLCLLLVLTHSLCPLPQKSIDYSSLALSHLDNIQLMFRDIATTFTKRTIIYQVDSTRYTILTTHTQFLYNNHYQKETYLSAEGLFRVDLGLLDILLTFDYAIESMNSTIPPSQPNSGSAMARAAFDPNFFQKQLILQNGTWHITSLNSYTFSGLFILQRNALQLQIIMKVLNGQLSSTDLHQDILSQLNPKYRDNLHRLFQNQSIASTSNFTYTYNRVQVGVVNKVLSANATQDGISIQYIFGTSATTPCPKLNPPIFSGQQQSYTLQSLSSLIPAQLFTLTIDDSWQVPNFQFFTGDLSNVINYVKRFPSMTPFSLACSNASTVSVSQFSNAQLYSQVVERCVGVIGGREVFALGFTLVYVVNIVAEKDQIKTMVQRVMARNIEYKSIDGMYKVTNQPLLKYYIESVVNGTVGGKCFGNAFPIQRNKYASVRITNEYLIVFDGSEV